MKSFNRPGIISILTASVIVFALISLSCNVPAMIQERFLDTGLINTPTPAPTNTPQPLPPTIVEADPPLGSTIPLSGPINLFFNQPMDQGSVEASLEVSPALAGSFHWTDPATLVFIPDSPFPQGQKVEFYLDTTAAAENGLSLTDPFRGFFFTPDWISATTMLPLPGSHEVDPASAIMVVFNQPIVPLGSNSQDFPPGLILTPGVSGEGEWLNTSTYQFKPTTGLAGGVTYQVNIPEELTSILGTQLNPADTSFWSFSTSYPRLLSFEPIDGEMAIELDKDIQLIFNQAMDGSSVADHFQVVNGQGDQVEGTLLWSDDHREATFNPDQLLDRTTPYTAILPGEVTSAAGTALGLDTSWGFSTTGDFAFLGTPAGQTYSPTIYEGVTLYFNNPVDRDSVLDNVTIFPEVGDLWPTSGSYGNVLNLYGDFEPLTSYSLRIKEGLADEWGDTLGIIQTLNFTTQPLPPNLTVSQGSSVLYLTGTENAIPAWASNLYQISINIGTIPEQAFGLFFGPGRYESLDDYYPPDVKYWDQIFNVKGDDSYSINLPLNQAGTELAPGLYRYQIYSSELPYNPSPYLLAVSSNHLMMKTSPENVLIWAIDLETGKPLANTDIKIFEDTGELFREGKTDLEGIYQEDFPQPLDLYDRVFYAVSGTPGEENFGITSSDWAFGIEPYNFGLDSNYGVPQPQTYIYTDRPIYRPGQTIYYRLVHRDREDGRYAIPADKTIQVTLYQNEGIGQEVTLPLSKYGTAHGQFQLSSHAGPGYYRLETEYGMVLFQVAEYRKPEINLGLTLNQAEILPGEEWQGDLSARYYFDAPASEIDLSWSLRAQGTDFYLPGYQVGVLDSDWFVYPGYHFPPSWGSMVASGEGITDIHGTWTILDQVSKIDQYENEIILPAVYFLSVTAQDESGFQVSSQAEMLVHPSDFYIGVDPSAWIVEADQQVDFEILTVDWEKEPAGVHSLTAEFNKVSWKYEIGEIGQVDYTRELELISKKKLSTNRSGEAVVDFTPPAPGTYQLDVYGGGARTEVTLWVGGTGTVNWPTQSNQKINLVADQKTYLPGDEARIFIPNPFPTGAEVLVTIERHKVIDYQTLHITSSGEMITLPLDSEDAPNVYVSVILIGDGPGGIKDFRQGYLNLLVEPSDRILNVEVIGNPERLGPGEEVAVKIRVSDQDGKPLVGEFSLAVVDLAVLALADPNSPEIGEAFYGIQPLAVRLGFPLGVHAGRNVFVPGGLGGGGGDAEFTTRDDFDDTSYWQADLVTNINGEAQVKFQLPDNLTTWQVDARGVTVETDVGQGTTQIITSKDLLIRPVTPRFLVAGDHLALAAVVHNNTDSDLTADVSLQSGGISLDDPEFAIQEVEIKAGSRTRVEWWGSVEDVEQAELLFSARAGDLQDAVRPYLGPLPVYRYTAPTTYGTAGVLSEQGNLLEVVTLPRSFDPSTGSLDIEISPSLAAVLLKALDALESQEKLSSDALISHFLPNVITYASIQELEQAYPLLENRLGKLIPETLEVLAASQNEDGGWGWWQGGTSDEEISSYILFGLVKAQQSGVFVDDTLIQNARGYLLATLPAVEMLTQDWQYNLLAFKYFALAESGIEVSSGMVSLIPFSSQISPANQALLALALESQLPDNEHSRSLYSNLASSAIHTATGTHWESPETCRCWLNNTVSTTAMINYALARTGGFSDLISQSTRYLVAGRSAGGDWGSAYASAWSILALNEVLLQSGELRNSFEFSAGVNGSDLITGLAEGSGGLEAATASLPIEQLYPDHPNALTITHGEGEGNLYYKTHLQVYRPAADVQPFGKGLSISRVYADIDLEDPVVFTQSANVGDLIQVQLTLVVENDLRYLVVEDRIPAGAEVLDTRLNTSRQDQVEYQAGAPLKDGWGWWYFNKPAAYDHRVVWAADFVPAGTYQLVYTISLTHPGEYQVLPARAWQQYFPEVQAVSAGDMFTVDSGN